ncbi:DUF2987 domain-containing protein [Brumicola nitratireducens]|uniref:DUF2987 domain-containing protein n=1 Tax=Glaciecola nitratireducens (strain JCM 12485 / KCTC 12276 / FR1064) TaxID=1085623 RepID=G4QHE6_GLANF|nr:DUF2987 domain-containing protein [Glaciecola nitratireducens]AEP29932.1 hypothetical protein GNIT_1823 [Glaciecola nitratireducens FR1064]
MQKPILLVVLAMLLTQVAYADEVEVSYKTFYSHVKKLDNEDTQALQFAFGFKHVGTGELCTINKARISTQKVQLPLTVTAENRFTIQSEKALSLADAFVVIDFKEPSNQCDISVQLETKPEFLKAEYTFEEMQFIYEQYEAFFNEMGSFLSFMMPTVKGLMFQFSDQDLREATKTGEMVNAGTLMLDDEWFERKKGLKLQTIPLRITAMASK